MEGRGGARSIGEREVCEEKQRRMAVEATPGGPGETGHAEEWQLLNTRRMNPMGEKDPKARDRPNSER